MGWWEGPYQVSDSRESTVEGGEFCSERVSGGGGGGTKPQHARIAPIRSSYMTDGSNGSGKSRKNDLMTPQTTWISA